MHEKIMDIQNSVWNLYKDFIKTKDMRQYNARAQALVKKYEGDELLFTFVQNIIISWVPIINRLKEEENEK